MKSKKKLLEKSRLYAIIDKKTCGLNSAVDLLNKIKNKGVEIVQYRDKDSGKETILKTAFALKKIIANTNCLFIMNDYLDIAKISDADGIHLGQDDISIDIARRILGRDKIIGVSCHSLTQAKKAQREGADYISIGPIFATPTKPKIPPVGLNLIKDIKDNIKVPFFAIGGINKNNIKEILSYGIKRVAVCRAVCQGNYGNDPIRIR